MLINGINSANSAVSYETQTINTADLSSKDGKVANGGAVINATEKVKPTDEKKVKEVLDGINQKLENTSTRIEYTIHEKSNRISIKIIDKNTDEIVREVPSEKTIKMLEEALELAGLFVDEKM